MLLSEYLTSLGQTPDQVANCLRAQRVKGIIKSSCHCPILNGIYQACPDYWPGLRITNGYQSKDGHWHYYASLSDLQITDPALPQAVQDFIGKFDRGEYPDLVATKVEVQTVKVWQ